jgi:hypothetical protein
VLLAIDGRLISSRDLLCCLYERMQGFDRFAAALMDIARDLDVLAISIADGRYRG